MPASRHSAPEQSPGFLLWRVTLSWQRQMRAALARHDLTHVQFVLLASLWWLQEHGGGPPTQAGLAEHAGTEEMMTSQVLRRLAARGLLRRDPDPADGRARRLGLTPAGRELASAWLSRPASKNRDVRSELLVKLALLDRAGADPGPLLDAQRDRLIPVAAALQDRLAEAASFDRTLILWRYETLSATLRFLEALRSEALAAAPAS